MADTLTSLELRTRISAGELTLSLEPVEISPPGPDEVIVRVEAAPINPSDLGLLLGPADMSTLRAGGTADRPTLTASIPEARMPAMRPRLDQSLAVGNEGAGTVIQAGTNVQHLIGRKVGMIGGAMYAQYRKIHAQSCIPLPEGASAADGASMFVNPLTSLAMVETLRSEGHKALVHTAAASNLGQMLNRICIADGVPLVNIVRSDAQAQILREIGAKYIIDSSTPDFREKLTDAIAETGATLAFDAIGGGRLVNTILHAMEAAINRTATEYSRYGSATWKQVYVYGMLDTGIMELDRGYGLAWGVSGFLLTPFLMKAGMETNMRLRARVAAELKTTFASHYSRTISLADVLDPAIAAEYNKKATGEKFLIDPTL
ncbi:MAG: zinc-binding dehydrogenase [Sphingomonas sp.]|uniref:zinc-binding dehydrogenase n=1 Tax=Sphingomonas sp. TaxID=28214 RepID=UPI0025FC12BE|nr:zinc-binding dehydrogenase [Sphingomonas sp.]MBX3565121.1 zinc-binding dehydrogenase [Sphingomonas sp.]